MLIVLVNVIQNVIRQPRYVIQNVIQNVIHNVLRQPRWRIDMHVRVMGTKVEVVPNKVVKSFRLGQEDLNAIKVFMEAEDIDQSTAVRSLIQYGILYYTMQVINDNENENGT